MYCEKLQSVSLNIIEYQLQQDVAHLSMSQGELRSNKPSVTPHLTAHVLRRRGKDKCYLIGYTGEKCVK